MVLNLHDVPGDHHSYVHTDSVGAGDATEDQVIFVAPFDCVVTGVFVTPDAAVTGDATNTKNLNVDNKGSDGSGTTEIANLDLASGTNLVEADETTISSSITTSLTAGDVLMVEIEQVGSGVAIPRCIYHVTYRGN